MQKKTLHPRGNSTRKQQKFIPASFGTSLQHWIPLLRMKFMSLLSSSIVHGPRLSPAFSQQGCLPIAWCCQKQNGGSLYIQNQDSSTSCTVQTIQKIYIFHQHKSWLSMKKKQVHALYTISDMNLRRKWLNSERKRRVGCRWQDFFIA